MDAPLIFPSASVLYPLSGSSIVASSPAVSITEPSSDWIKENIH